MFDAANTGRGIDTSGQYAATIANSTTPGDRWCIAVIDEVSTSNATIATQYAVFRELWPNRKLFLLIPSEGALTGPTPATSPNGEAWSTGPYGALFVPQQAIAERATGLFTGPTQVNRDGGVVGNRSNWFTLCGLGVLPAGAKVGLFVDNSGSMTTSTVQASYDKFLADVAAAGLSIITVTNGNEEWTEPFRYMSGV